MTRQLGHLNIEAGGRDEAQVSEVTTSHKIIRHVVNIKDHVCTCREWQVSGKPCAHALALIITVEMLRWKTTWILIIQCTILD
jgi:hypothetical protein